MRREEPAPTGSTPKDSTQRTIAGRSAPGIAQGGGMRAKGAGPLERLAELALLAGERCAVGWMRFSESKQETYEVALEFCARPVHAFGPVANAARRDAFRWAGITDARGDEAREVWRDAFEEGFLACLDRARKEAGK
jgi:hypothetical protein